MINLVRLARITSWGLDIRHHTYLEYGVVDLYRTWSVDEGWMDRYPVGYSLVVF